MKKKIMKLLFVAVVMLGINTTVYAKEDVYYTTPNGIELTQKEYDFLTQYYWEGYPDIMTKQQYSEFANSDLLTRQLIVKTVKIPTGDAGKGTVHGTTYKTLRISAACDSTSCSVNLNAEWHYDPVTRSYDVIGVYLSGVSGTHGQTYVYSTSGVTYYSNLKTAYNGIGNSVKLPNSGSNIIVNMSLNTSRGGVIYGSYQHAMSNISLANSKLYNFSLGGYGNVFSFYGAATGVYDGMGGVDITV